MNDTLVLGYHAISERWPAPLSVTPARFAEQLERLARRGYSGVTISDALSAGGPGKRVAITFDDAYLSVLELAEPILRRVGFVATVYAPTSFVGSARPMSWPGIERWLGGPHEAELMPLSWQDLGSLCERGWEVGSHTVTHAKLTGLADDALRWELEQSRLAIECRLGGGCDSVAYPYGDHDARVVDVARAAGYRSGVTLPARLHPARPLRWPRIGVYHGDDRRRFALKTSPLARRLRSRSGRRS